MGQTAEGSLDRPEMVGAVERPVDEALPLRTAERVDDLGREPRDSGIDRRGGYEAFLHGELRWKQQPLVQRRDVDPFECLVGDRRRRLESGIASGLQRASVKRSQNPMCAKSAAAVQGGSISRTSCSPVRRVASVRRRSSESELRRITSESISGG